MPVEKEVWLLNLDFKDYGSALDFQRKLWELRAQNDIPDTLVLAEHDHAITSGKSANKEDLLVLPDELQNLGLSVYEIERGGEYTYHGPGQLVGYPIIRLEGERGIVTQYVAKLEEVMIRTLGEFGIEGNRRTGFPGVWVDSRKIGSLGVAVRRWITYHGFALNVNTDLDYFRFIRSCGLDWKVMTSMAQVLSGEVNIEEVGELIVYHFSQTFGTRIIEKDYADIAETSLAPG